MTSKKITPIILILVVMVLLTSTIASLFIFSDFVSAEVPVVNLFNDYGNKYIVNHKFTVSCSPGQDHYYPVKCSVLKGEVYTVSFETSSTVGSISFGLREQRFRIKNGFNCILIYVQNDSRQIYFYPRFSSSDERNSQINTVFENVMVQKGNKCEMTTSASYVPFSYKEASVVPSVPNTDDNVTTVDTTNLFNWNNFYTDNQSKPFSKIEKSGTYDFTDNYITFSQTNNNIVFDNFNSPYLKAGYPQEIAMQFFVQNMSITNDVPFTLIHNSKVVVDIYLPKNSVSKVMFTFDYDKKYNITSYNSSGSEEVRIFNSGFQVELTSMDNNYFCSAYRPYYGWKHMYYSLGSKDMQKSYEDSIIPSIKTDAEKIGYDKGYNSGIEVGKGLEQKTNGALSDVIPSVLGSVTNFFKGFLEYKIFGISLWSILATLGLILILVFILKAVRG